MRATFQNSGIALSIGVFFSLMIAGLAGTLPHTLSPGLQAQGVPAGDAAHVAQLPPVSTLFAAFLGDNPIGHLLGSNGVLATLPAKNRDALTGKTFFPQLVSGPFHHGLVLVFIAAAAMAAIAAVGSAMRGTRYVHTEENSMTDAIRAETVTIKGHGDDEIEAYAARPLHDRPRGGVVVIHHMPGYDQSTKEMVRTFAANGYAAVCPNLYAREAPGADPDDAAADRTRRRRRARRAPRRRRRRRRPLPQLPATAPTARSA